jgi:hypothetical protein
MICERTTHHQFGVIHHKLLFFSRGGEMGCFMPINASKPFVTCLRVHREPNNEIASFNWKSWGSTFELIVIYMWATACYDKLIIQLQVQVLHNFTENWFFRWLRYKIQVCLSTKIYPTRCAWRSAFNKTGHEGHWFTYHQLHYLYSCYIK